MKAGGGPIAVTLRTKRGTKEVTVPADRSILEASLDAGVAMPYSCAMGGCGACRVKLVSGDMEMDEPNCLSPEERKEGYVLTCVGHPKTPVVLEVP
jgi:ferredoxin